MEETRKYSRAVLIFNAVAILFCIAAVVHMSQKADLPDNLSSSPARSGILEIDGSPVSTSDDVEFFLSSYRIGDTVRLTTATPGPAKTASVVLVANFPPTFIWINVGIAAALLLMGLFVYLRRPQDEAAKVFNLGSSAVAVGMQGMKTIYALGPALLGNSLCVLFILNYTLVPVLFLHFTLVFPAIRWPAFRRQVRWLYLFAAAMAVWESRLYVQAAAGRSLELFQATAGARMVENGFVFLILLLSVLNFINSYRRADSPTEKRKLRWMLLGLCCGPSPFIFLWVLPLALGFDSLIPEVVFKFFLLLIPVTLTISILRYRILDIDVIITRSAAYVIVIGALLALYVGVVGGLATVFKFSSVYVSAAVAVIVALVFEPVRRNVQRVVDRRFFRVLYNYRQVQREFVDSIRECLGVQDLADLMVERVSTLIPVECIGFFTLREPGRRIQLLAHRNFDLLVGHGVRLETEQIRSDLKRMVALEDSIEPGIAFEPANAAVFRKWGMTLVVPMLSEAGDILGFLVLGRKKSGGRFTEEDVDLLSTVSMQAGLAMERTALQQQLMLKQEEARRLEELNQLKSYFVSSVSHDLKTPLTSIRMYAELLKTRKSMRTSTAAGYLDVIEGEADRLTRLINNVLDFAKMERGLKEYQFAETSLQDIVNDVLQALKYQLKMGKFVLRTQLTKNRMAIQADGDAVAEALINLLSNAMKYSDDRRNITVATFRKDGFACVRVKDRGIGIPANMLGNIFDPFFRVASKQTQPVGGVGLGLSIVKHIVDAHRGKIDVESSLGRGTSFTLLFPMRKKSSSGRSRREEGFI